jgi:hypothetical protein
MKRITIALALVLLFTLPAVAEVEEITAGGDIQIRAQYLAPGMFYGWQLDDSINANDWVSQRTKVNLDAKLTGGIRGFIELSAYDFWGLDPDDLELAAIDPTWPGGYPYFVDQQKNLNLFAGQGNDFVNLYQAYIEMNDIADYPVQVRIGRQEIVEGREWVLGNNDAGVNFAGLAFDAIKVRYADDAFAVDAWSAKLLDLSSPLQMPTFTGAEVEEDADIDFYGVYGSYMGLENIVIDAYWMLVRNGNSSYIGPPLVSLAGNVDYLHTVGARVAGSMDLELGTLDYGLEGAFQFGDNQVDEDYEGWALNAMAGLTFATDYSPRVELEYAYFSGEDDLSDGDTSEFVRLFSDVHYGEMNLGGTMDAALSNMHVFRLGASANPCEKSTVSLDVLYFMLAEDDSDGAAKVFGLPQFVSDPDDEVGIELDLTIDYQYTEDLLLSAGWAHLFVDDAMENSWGNGRDQNDDDIDYLYVEAQLTF